MSTSPQAVTERYVSNLIHYGENRDFNIDMIVRRQNIINGDQCGHYYTAKVAQLGQLTEANGATISQAVRCALEKHGVTFR
jgi:hypothetical protein